MSELVLLKGLLSPLLNPQRGSPNLHKISGLDLLSKLQETPTAQEASQRPWNLLPEKTDLQKR